ncbi:MAG: hypothetical protein M3404_02485 [Actinomycetota bacterium]|nr:hypothetical protein [Actinomycetota bacterium]
MAATTGNAIKAHLEAGGLGLTGYRDKAPDQPSLPFFTVREAIALVPHPAMPHYDDAQGIVTETVQVDLWEAWQKPTQSGPTVSESYTLADDVARRLNQPMAASGSSAPPSHVWQMRLTSRARLFEEKANLIHHVFTVEVRRQLQRI